MEASWLILVCSFFMSMSLYSEDNSDCSKDTIINELVSGKTMPGIFGQTINDTNVDTSYFYGYVTILNFTYIGCPPCMAEIKYLNKLHEEYKGKPFKILSIAAINKEGILQFLDKKDTTSSCSLLRRYYKIDTVKYDLMPECSGRNQNYSNNGIRPQCFDITKRFGLVGYPMTIIIDKKRVVHLVLEGFSMEADDDYLVWIKEKVDELLK